ncbi:hypothetical protein H5410_039810 [Solanum commersonii]|uniref:Uncharacterized protein n=1 Tax=Solanum commersonii TaxID=4109 RepID=A0A9J5XQA6_SOLCO|nr:hypothetical protein H5410_039810 [Solanum commersonii]
MCFDFLYCSTSVFEAPSISLLPDSPPYTRWYGSPVAHVFSSLPRFSCVKTTSFANNHEKHATFKGALVLQICFHGHMEFCATVEFRSLYPELTLYAPLLCPFHHSMSTPFYRP